MEIGLLILRVALGGAMALQGAAKLTRSGRQGTAPYFDGIGFRPAAPLVAVAGLTELGAGILLGVGLATPLAAAGLVAVLVSAVVVKAVNGYWNTGDGCEYPLLAALAVAALAFTGPGEVSVDAAIGWDGASTGAGIAAVAGGIVAAAPLLVRRAAALRARPVPSGRPVEEPA